MQSSVLLRFVASVALLSLVACGDSAAEDGSEPLPIPSGSSSGGGEGGEGGEGGAGGGTTTSTGIGGAGACEGTGAVVAEDGAEDRFLLRGTIIAPSGPLTGEVLVEGNTITCVAASCASQAGANGATVIVTDGVISAGLIDTHNHALFNFLDEDDWTPTVAFGNHEDWKSDDPMYAAALDAKQYFNMDTGAPTNPPATVRYSCEIMKYAETRALISGTTSVVGAPGAVNRSCYKTVARTVDTTQNGLGFDRIQTSLGVPTASTGNTVCNNFDSGSTDAYVVHIAEGIDGGVANEFNQLGTVTQNQPNGAGCLYNPKTTIVHGTDMSSAQFDVMAQNQMGLSWSPRSNVFLYGLGTDLSKTTDIPLVLSKNIVVALSPDWTLGGSQNLLDEMRFADRVDDQVFGDILGAAELHDMVTFNAARVLGLDNHLGSIAVGRRADIAIYLSQGLTPYEAVLAATPRETVLVMVDGRVLYADAALETIAPSNTICEPFEACCRPKVLCIAESGHPAADQLDQTYAEFSQVLEDAMVAYDALNFSPYKFAPISPVLKCGPY